MKISRYFSAKELKDAFASVGVDPACLKVKRFANNRTEIRTTTSTSVWQIWKARTQLESAGVSLQFYGVFDSNDELVDASSAVARL